MHEWVNGFVTGDASPPVPPLNERERAEIAYENNGSAEKSHAQKKHHHKKHHKRHHHEDSLTQSGDINASGMRAEVVGMIAEASADLPAERRPIPYEKNGYMP